MAEHKHIYLAPPCCAEGHGDRVWCEDDVWPCDDCPNPDGAKAVRYKLDSEWTECTHCGVRFKIDQSHHCDVG